MGALSATGKCKFWGEKGWHSLVRALASHQCGPGANPGVDVICGLSLLLVLSFALKVFFSLKNQQCQTSNQSGTPPYKRRGHVSSFR